MKLLDKKTVDTLKAVERKKEIDEGAKLAKRVDALRELSAKEEANLTKFRDESLKKIREEIETEAQKRDVLKAENVNLEEQNRVLRIPLDIEWEEVKSLQSIVEAREDVVSENEISLGVREKNIADREVEIFSEEEVVRDKHHEVKNILSEASDIKSKIEEELHKIQQEGDAIIHSMVLREKELKRREDDFEVRLRDFNNKEEQYQKDIKWLEEERIRLADREQTFEREIKRHNKKL